jgi:hypothetical protein
MSMEKINDTHYNHESLMADVLAVREREGDDDNCSVILRRAAGAPILVKCLITHKKALLIVSPKYETVPKVDREYFYKFIMQNNHS